MGPSDPPPRGESRYQTRIFGHAPKPQFSRCNPWNDLSEPPRRSRPIASDHSLDASNVPAVDTRCVSAPRHSSDHSLDANDVPADSACNCSRERGTQTSSSGTLDANNAIDNSAHSPGFGNRSSSDGSKGPYPSARRVLLVAAADTLAIAAMSHLLPAECAGIAVGIAFLWISYRLVARDAASARVRHFGLSLGGLFEPEPLDGPRILRETVSALVWALAVAAIVFPPFLVGFVGWWRPTAGFVAAPLRPVLDDLAGQLLMVALPEEAFYRGYLQTSLDDCWKTRWKWLGGHFSPGLLVASVIFALGHVLTEPHPNRLAVFFPSLLFGWLRSRTAGIGAGVFFHAFCNLYSGYLGRSFGMWH